MRLAKRAMLEELLQGLGFRVQGLGFRANKTLGRALGLMRLRTPGRTVLCPQFGSRSPSVDCTPFWLGFRVFLA